MTLHFLPFLLLLLLLPHHSTSNQATKLLTPEQRALIVDECCEENVSPSELARKWGCNADTIRTWVRKAGRQLPKQYKKSSGGYPDSPGYGTSCSGSCSFHQLLPPTFALGLTLHRMALH